MSKKEKKNSAKKIENIIAIWVLNRNVTCYDYYITSTKIKIN